MRLSCFRLSVVRALSGCAGAYSSGLTYVFGDGGGWIDLIRAIPVHPKMAGIFSRCQMIAKYLKVRAGRGVHLRSSRRWLAPSCLERNTHGRCVGCLLPTTPLKPLLMESGYIKLNSLLDIRRV